MATQVQNRRGTTAQHSTFTGAAGEITVDTDKKTVVVHNGLTAGGFPLAPNSAFDVANSKVASVTGTAGQIFSSGGTTPTINLISSGVTATTYGGATQIPVLVVDSFGRITSAANASVQGMDYVYANNIWNVANAAFARGNTSAQLAFFRVAANGTNLDAASNADTLTVRSSNNIILIANSTNDSLQITQSPSGVTATTYGGATNIPAITVDAYGRVTSASNVAVSSGGLTVGDQTTSASTFYPLFTTTTSGSASVANVSSTKLYFVPSNGTLSATVFVSLSDIKVKEDIVTISNATEYVKQLEGVEFRWKDNKNKSAGVIAQELERILPHLVEEDINGTKSVNYSGIIAYLIQSVKELSSRIEELERR